MSPTDLAKQYFAHMRAGDLGVVDLFHDDAVLLGLGRITRGRDAIRDFYAGAIEEGRPQPGEPLALLADERRVFAQVEIQLGDGGCVHAVDLFEVDAGRIRQLTYFIADLPAEDGEA